MENLLIVKKYPSFVWEGEAAGHKVENGYILDCITGSPQFTTSCLDIYFQFFLKKAHSKELVRFTIDVFA